MCLNDNMDSSKSDENEFVRTILNDFYLSLLPKASKFELPVEYRNRFDNIYELRNWKQSRYNIRVVVYIFISVLSMFLMCTLCKLRICNRIRRALCLPCI